MQAMSFEPFDAGGRIATRRRGGVPAARRSGRSGRVARIAVVAVLLATCITASWAGPGRGRRDPTLPARIEALATWSRSRDRDGWPLSNVGATDLRGVMFLHDLAITAQRRLASGEAAAAGELLRRVARRWPRAKGGLVDSLDVARGQAFDRLDGAPRVTNGPGMLLALSARTVWAAGAQKDDDLLRLAREDSPRRSA